MKLSNTPSSRLSTRACIIFVAFAIGLAACGPTENASRVKNAALPSGSASGAARIASAPPQIFLKIDTVDTTPYALEGTPKFVAKLNWSAPTNDGGSPVTGYDIQFRWNSFESRKNLTAAFRSWTSCADQNRIVPDSFPACAIARKSSATSAEISSDYWQSSYGPTSPIPVKELSHLVHGLEYRVAAINAVGTSSYSPATQLTCKYGGACEFGDLGPGGGVIYDVPTATDTGTAWRTNGASEVAGADWEYSGNHTWAAMGWAAETDCPGWSCYSPTPPLPCAKTKTTPVRYASSPDTCLARDAWHLPFAMPLINVAEWRPLCNKFDDLASTWGRLRGGSGFFYWSASNVVIPAGISVNLTVGNIATILLDPDPAGIVMEMTQEAYENWSTSALERSQAIRFPCDSTTKSVTGAYNSSGRLYTASGEIYHDNSVRTGVGVRANLSRPIRTFVTNKPGLAPQLAPVVSAQPGDGGVVLTWRSGTPSLSLSRKLSSAQVLPLTDYVVEYKASNSTSWTRLPATNSVSMVRTLGNGVLSPNVQYDFRVAEKNGLGVGPFSSPVSSVPGKFFQNVLSISPQTAQFPALDLFTSGGDGAGNVTYTVTNGTASNCRISGSVLTVTQVGTCIVVATKAADAIFLGETSEPTTITFTQAPQQPVVITTLSGPFDKPLTLSTSGGDGNGAVSYEVYDSDRDICSVSGAVLTFTPRIAWLGSCRVSARKAASTNFLAATSAVTTINFTAGSQAAVVVDPPPAAQVPAQRVVITARGGSGGGQARIAVRNGTATNCAVGPTTERGGVISADVSANNFGIASVSAGTCIVTVTRAADGIFNEAKSDDVTVTFTKGAQAKLSLNGPSIGSRGGLDLETSGGSGSGAVSYSIAATTPPNTTWKLANNCRIVGNKLVADTVGGCWVVATKAADNAYDATTSDSREYSMTRADQAPFMLSVAPNTASVGTNASIRTTTSGGSGTGTVVFEARDGTATGCSLVGTTVSARTVGTCIVVATKASDPNFWEALAEATFTFTRGTQATLRLPSGLRGRALELDQPVILTTTGGSGSGDVTYAVTDSGSAGCSVESNRLTAQSEGTCDIRATKAADSSFVEAISDIVTIPFDVRIGDTGPGGGIVGYVANETQTWGRYIEVAPDTWTTGSDPTTNWATALQLASSYRGGGRSDWRLPSLVENNFLTGRGYLYDPNFSYGYWSYDGLSSNWNPDRRVRPIRTFG